MLDELHRPAVALEHGGDEPVVAEVLLACAGGDDRRHGLDAAAAAAHAGDEAGDARVALEAGLVRIEPPAEEAPRLEEEAAEDAGPRPVGVQRGERAEARAQQQRPAL